MYTKKNLLFFLAVLIFSGSSVFAQSSSASAPVYISIKKALSIGAIGGDLNFGTILYGSTSVPSKSPDSGAKFLIDGSEKRAINVTYGSVTLNNSFTGGGTLTFTPIVEQTGSSSTYVSGAAPLASGSPTNTGSDGKMYVWVGGGIDFTPTTPEGEYTGTFTMSIAYN